MEPRQRQRSARANARLIAACAALAVVCALAWRATSPTSSRAAYESLDDGPREAVATRAAKPPSALAASEVERRVEAIVERWLGKAGDASAGRIKAGGSHVGVHVVALDGAPGEVAIEADLAMTPASNMKLVTSAAALVLLGLDWQFDTRCDSAGNVSDGHLRGDLVVRAAGDPLYESSGDGSVDARLRALARDLRARGIRQVDGDLVLDEGNFAAPSVAPGWPGPEQHWEEYCALSAGLTANRGCVTVHVTPGEVGRPARVTVEPHDHGLPQTFDVETIAKGKLVVNIGANGKNGLVVRGKIPRGMPWSDSCAHRDPVELFGSAFAGALEAEGVHLAGHLRRQRSVEAQNELAHLRTPLSATLRPINTDSTNAVADQVFLAVGNAVTGAGSREGGARATQIALERLGVPSAGLVQVDGSGLSRDNKVSARQITALLCGVMNLGDRTSQAFADSLAVGGESGKLSSRLDEPDLKGRVRAKTGYIAGVSSLSGLVEGADGVTYAFSILVEYPDVAGMNTKCWKPMQDEIVAYLAGLGT